MLGEQHLICIVNDAEAIQAEINGYTEVYNRMINDVLSVAQGLTEEDLQFRTDHEKSVWFDTCKKSPTNKGWKKHNDGYRPDKRTKEGKQIAEFLKQQGSIPTVSKYWADLHGLYEFLFFYPESFKLRYVVTAVICNEEKTEFAIMYPNTPDHPASDEARAKLNALGKLITYGDYYDNYKDRLKYYAMMDK